MMSENLKRLRKEKGLTQVELAEKLNLYSDSEGHAFESHRAYHEKP